jgi:hypothetical protein
MNDVLLIASVIEEPERLPLVGASLIDVAAADGRVMPTGTIINPIHSMLIGFAVPEAVGQAASRTPSPCC